MAGGSRLLVVGGAGFVLSNIALEWFEGISGGSTCVIFDRAEVWDHAARTLFEPLVRSGRLAFFDGDVTSPESWRQLAEQHGRAFTHVVAGAAVTPTPDEERADPARVLRVNLDGLVQCLEWARCECHGLERFVHVSSDAVLGVPDLVRPSPGEFAAAAGTGPRESGEVPHMSVYAISKVAGEAVVRRWRELFSIDAVSVRFSDVYGRMDRDTGARNKHNAPYWVCRKALRIRAGEAGATFKVAAASLDEHGWDYVDAPSVARGVIAILRAEARPKRSVYHLALGRCVSHRELIEAAAEGLLDSAVDTELVDASSATAAQADVQTLADPHWLRDEPIDVKSMQSEFGWEATPLKEAVGAYMHWLQSGELTFCKL